MTKNWERYRAVIINLYKQQNLPLHEVQRILRDQYGFNASIRAYRTRFDKWRVSKYNCQRRRDSNCTHWSSDSDPLSFSPKDAPGVTTLTGTSGPHPVPVQTQLRRPGDSTRENHRFRGSPSSPVSSPTATSSSYSGSPPTPEDESPTFEVHGKLSSFPSSLNPMVSSLSRPQQPLPCIQAQALPQAPGLYPPASATENSPGQPPVYPYYGSRMASAGYFNVATCYP